MPDSVEKRESFFRSKWDGCSRLRIYSLCGFVLWVTGFTMLYVCVDHLRMNVFFAQMLFVPFVMAVISYFVLRRKAFADRPQLTPQNKKRYSAVRGGGFGVSKVLFLVFVPVLGIHYLLASLLIAAALWGPTYKLNRDWAFAQKSEKTQKTAPV